jgi:regulator of protease activity HflC (stomatin/prohibitin superfamily)
MTDLVDEQPTRRERIAEGLIRAQFWLYTGLVVVLLALVVLWPRIFITIPPGSRGVMFRFLGVGTITDETWPEGLHIIPPWDKLTLYEVRLQHQKLSFEVLTVEGLQLTVDIAVRYQPTVEILGFLHQNIGPEYYERLVRPEIEAHVRRTFGSRPAHELYASTRDMLQELSQVPMLAHPVLADPTGVPYVHVQELKLTGIELPQVVEAAIAEKYRQEQLMLEYEYKLEREEREAERKRTEAAGIRDYNLIAGELSHDLLRWRSIDATTALATAPNSKVVVLGGGNQRHADVARRRRRQGRETDQGPRGAVDRAVGEHAVGRTRRPRRRLPTTPPCTAARRYESVRAHERYMIAVNAWSVPAGRVAPQSRAAG